jgi:di/tricarboxylate transporter
LRFSILGWQCPNFRGENPAIGVLLIVLGCFFLVVSFHKNAKIGPAFSSQSRRYPARLWQRIIFGFVGVAAIYTGMKIVLLCR